MTIPTAENQSEPLSLAAVICAAHKNRPEALIEILHDIQAQAGFISEQSQRAIAHALNLSRAEVHGVVSFYHDFHTAPGARIAVKVCRAEACQSLGANKLIADLLARLGAELGQPNAAGILVEPVYCLGNCALSPAAMVGPELVGRADADRLESKARSAIAGAAE